MPLTKDLYNGSVGVGVSSPYKTVQAVAIVDENGNQISTPIPVDIGGAQVTIQGPVTIANEVEINNDAGHPVPMSVDTLPLPSGAATSANQTTANQSLSSIDRKLPEPNNGRIPVDVGTSVEISNDVGNPVPVSGSVITSVTSRTPTTVSIPSSVSSVLLVGANSNRKGLFIYNNSTATLDLSFSNPATNTNSFVELPAGAFLILDQQLIVPNAIYGFWSNANGTAQVTEFV